ncbi:MAG: Spo0B domain-containing protein [Clostridia bacterium]|nr:Spo0B domain-containing protein [Clostridia bacterium]
MKNAPNIKKTANLLVLISIVQVLALVFLTGYALVKGEIFSAPRFYYQYMLIVILVAASIVSCLILLSFKGTLLRSDNKTQTLQATLTDMEKLNQTLRAQRHDFLNHLQVVYGLIEMDEYKDARDYIEKVYNDIQRVSRVLKTSNPAVNALIQAKMLDAEKKGVKADFNSTSRLDGLPIPSWEMCRILGNLIDNALDSLEERSDSRFLKIDLSEDLKSFYFKVQNNGPEIPEALLNKIFEAGFTTKGDKGEGMGLAITREIVEQYGGSIHVTSTKELTLFEGSIPKRDADPKTTLQNA